MTLLDRVFLGISALVLVIFAGLTAATLFGSDVLVAWLNSPSFGFDGSLVALILVLLAAYLVVLIGRMDTSKYIVYQRELGTVLSLIHIFFLSGSCQRSGVRGYGR